MVIYVGERKVELKILCQSLCYIIFKQNEKPILLMLIQIIQTCIWCTKIRDARDIQQTWTMNPVGQQS